MERAREREREKQNMIMCKHLLNQLIFEFLFCVYMLGSVLFPSLHPLLYCCTPAVFRAGEQGRFWYAVLGGSLEVRYHTTDTETKVRIVNTPFPVFYLFNFFSRCTQNTKFTSQFVCVFLWSQKDRINQIL